MSWDCEFHLVSKLSEGQGENGSIPGDEGG